MRRMKTALFYCFGQVSSMQAFFGVGTEWAIGAVGAIEDTRFPFMAVLALPPDLFAAADSYLGWCQIIVFGWMPLGG